MSGAELNGNLDDLTTALKEMQNTSIYEISPVRITSNKEYSGYIKGISNFREVSFEDDGVIVAKMVSGEFRQYKLPKPTLRIDANKRTKLLQERLGKEAGNPPKEDETEGEKRAGRKCGICRKPLLKKIDHSL